MNDGVSPLLMRLLILFALGSASNVASPRVPRGISGPWPQAFPAKDLCSNCGLCLTSQVRHVKEACAFLGDGMSRIETMEPQEKNPIVVLC